MPTTNIPTESKRLLSKSRFKLALECPAKLNYTGNNAYVNAKNTNEMLKGLAEGGHQIGKLAQWVYAKDAQTKGIPWYEIETKGSQQQVAETQRYLQEHDQVILFEPTFVVDNFLVRVDVLVKHGNSIQLIEVKSKSFDSTAEKFPRNSKNQVISEFLPYLQDVAFQTMVVSKAYPQWQIQSYLMMPNKATTSSSANLHKHFKVTIEKSGERDHVHVAMPDFAVDIDHEFLCAINVDNEVHALFKGTLETNVRDAKFASIDKADEWAQAYTEQKLITTPLHPTRCSNCEFYCDQPNDSQRSGFHECWTRAGVPNFSDQIRRKETVLGIFNGSSIKKSALANQKYFLSDLDEDDVCSTPKLEADGRKIEQAQRQFMQVFGVPSNTNSFFDNVRFEKAQTRWVYPYYFLDFEGATTALPIRPGYRPNQQVVFQYSIHIMHEDGRIEHHEHYLDTNSNTADAHSKLLRRLKKDLGDKGTIFRWHSYENTVLNNLYNELKNSRNPPPDRDELLEFILSITEHKTRSAGLRNMVDQAKLAAQCYFHADTHGSSSIKAVLPAIMADSAYLRETYSQPIYGGDKAVMKSKNYQVGPGVTWWQEDANKPGKALDPYYILKNLTSNLVQPLADGNLITEAEEELSNNLEIADGGAALMAYVRIQAGVYNEQQQAQLEAAMLRYCELDTLAMVMIMQAWQHYSSS